MTETNTPSPDPLFQAADEPAKAPVQDNSAELEAQAQAEKAQAWAKLEAQVQHDERKQDMDGAGRAPPPAQPSLDVFELLLSTKAEVAQINEKMDRLIRRFM